MKSFTSTFRSQWRWCEMLSMSVWKSHISIQKLRLASKPICKRTFCIKFLNFGQMPDQSFFFFFYYQRPLIVTGYYITVKLEHAMPPYIRRPHKVSNPRTAVYFWQPWDALESCNQVFGFWYQHVSLIPIIDTDKMHCNHNKTVLFVQLECI